MKNNISVFNKDVGYPIAACQPFSVIPDNYLHWYKMVLEKGERLAPPDDTVQIHIVIPQVKITSGKSLVIDKVREFPNTIIKYYYSSGTEIFVTINKIYVNKDEYDVPYKKSCIGFTKTNLPVVAWLDNNNIKLLDLVNNKEIPFTCDASKIMDFEGRIYAQNGMNIIEIQFTEIKNTMFATPHIVANVLEQCTRFYPGVIVQNLFDSHYVSVFPESKQCQQIALRELDGLKVIDAKYENKILMLVAVDNKGLYNRFVFCFKEWNSYTLVEKKNINHVGINFTVLDNGLVIHVDEDENIELFQNTNLSNTKVVTDDVINHDMALIHKNAIVMFTKDNCIYSVKMK